MLRSIVFTCFLGFLQPILVPRTVDGQQKGHWERLALPGHGFIPSEVAFLNENSGIVTGMLGVNIARELSTTDGGKNFTVSDDVIGGKDSYRSLFAIPRHGYFFSANGGNLISQIGLRWFYHPDPNGGNGAAFFNYPLSIDSSVVIHIIRDGPLFGYASLDVDTGRVSLPIQGQLPPDPIEDGVAFDKDHILLSLSDSLGHSYTAHREADTGWAYSWPVDMAKWKGKVILEPVIKGFERDHFYVLGGKADTGQHRLHRLNDYYETWDGGATWKQENTATQGRIIRMANPAPNFLIALVSRGGYGYLQRIERGQDSQSGIPEKLVDSLFISTDDGATWAKDGTTFAGDTIVDMWWLSKDLGFVVSYQNGFTYLSRYTALQNFVPPIPHSKGALTLSPNPAAERTSFSSPFSGEITISIFDVLGRNRYGNSMRANRGEVIGIDFPASLKLGYYRLTVSNGPNSYSCSFIRAR